MVHIPSLSVLPSVSFPLYPSLSLFLILPPYPATLLFYPPSTSPSPLPRLPSLPSLISPPSSSLSTLPRLPSLPSLFFPLYPSIVFPLYPPSSSLSPLPRLPFLASFLSTLPRLPSLPLYRLPSLPLCPIPSFLSFPLPSYPPSSSHSTLPYLYAGLLDPRWIEEQKRQTEEKRNQEVNFATGVHIGSHLKNLAERRTDIFGVEETVIGKRIGEEMGGPGGPKKPPVVQWDGHSGR